MTDPDPVLAAQRAALERSCELRLRRHADSLSHHGERGVSPGFVMTSEDVASLSRFRKDEGPAPGRVEDYVVRS